MNECDWEDTLEGQACSFFVTMFPAVGQNFQGGEPCSIVLPPLEWALIPCNTLFTQIQEHLIPHTFFFQVSVLLSVACAPPSLSPAIYPVSASSLKFMSCHWLGHPPHLPVGSCSFSFLAWSARVLSFTCTFRTSSKDRNFTLRSLGSRAEAITDTFLPSSLSKILRSHCEAIPFAAAVWKDLNEADSKKAFDQW